MKKSITRHYCVRLFMKISVPILLVLLLAGISYARTGLAQEMLNRKVSVQAEDAALKSVLTQISKSSKVRFSYVVSLVDNRRVSISVKNERLEDVLEKLLKPLRIEYSVSEDFIILNKIPDTEPHKTGALGVGVSRSEEIIASIAEKTLTGKVATANGETLPGVNISIKGTTRGTSTDAAGKYSLNVPDEEAILVFSFVGYISQEVKVGTSSVIDIDLKFNDKSLDEVVVVGYGVQRKSDLTGAVTSIKGAELTKIGGSNAAEALQGKTPGVSILNQGGPGAAPTVFIRGLGTNGDAGPLYVVDGMMVSNIVYLAPSDIASMEILKDASATAIYGSRGANGVILITTKKGKTGKPVVNFSTSHGFQFLTRKYDVGDGKQYAQLVNLFKTNAGQAPLYDVDKVETGTDWMKESTQKRYVSDYQLSVAGGNDKVVYNVSASYHKEDGVLRYTSFDRLTVRANNEYKLSKKLTIGSNLSFASSNYKGNAGWNGGRGINSLYRISPLIPVRKADGNFSAGQDPDVINPYAALSLNKNIHTHPMQFVGNAYLNYEILNGLTFRSSYGTDFTLNKINSFLPAFNISSPNQIQASNSLESGYETKYSWLWENTLTYDKQIGHDHHINLLAGYTSQNYNYNILDYTGSGLLSTDPNYQYLQTLPTTSLSANTTLPTSESILSYLVRANYSFRDRYLLTASFRADGSSKFAPGNRWGNFPALALGWRASEEPFLKDIKWIDNLKLRGSWGQIGNNKIANYQTYSTLYQEATYSGVFNGVFYNSATITAASNPNITWEFSQQTDLGLEFATLNNRLKIEADYYNRDTKNLLLQLPIPGGSTGLSTPAFSNAGTVRNRGYEFSVSWDDNAGDFKYGVRLTGTANKNKILDFYGQTVYSGDWMVPSTHISKAGMPIGDFYGYKSAGIAQSQEQIDQLNQKAASLSGVAGKQYWSGLKPGDLLFQDLNGDGFIDVKDKTDIGSPHPKFIGGLTLTGSYKGFDFTADLVGSYGNKINNSARNQFLSSGLTNLNVEWLNSWTPTNTNTDIPRYAFNTSTSQQSDFTISDGSYFKARFIELGYTLSTKLLHKAGISSLRIYANTTNPFYLTKYKGFSPEVSNSYGVTTMGDDFRTYPVSGTARIGVNVIF